MSVGHCMDQALNIARLPVGDWAGAIERVRIDCPHADCGSPQSCRARVADYLRVQFRVLKNRASAPKGAR